MPERLTDSDERAEELTAAPKADPEDANERIELHEGRGGATRVEVADTAVVRPGTGEPRET